MPRWRLANKLNPAKKAWKSFTTKVQPKIHKILKRSLPNAVKAAAKHLLISFNYFLPSKLRSISNPSHHRNPNHFNTRQNYHMNKNAQQNIIYHKSFSAVHIDELFDPVILRNNYVVHEEITPGTSHDNNNNSKGKRMVDDDDHDNQRGNWGTSKSTLYSVDDAWKAVVAASPQLRCVDERAEEFIFKVKKDMKLQKDMSDLEFQEMLARGA